MPMKTQHAAAISPSAVVLPCDGRRTLVPDNQRDRAPAGYPHTGANTGGRLFSPGRYKSTWVRLALYPARERELARLTPEARTNRHSR